MKPVTEILADQGTWIVQEGDKVQMGQQLNSGGSPGRIITAPMDGIILETSPAKLLLGCAHAVSLGGLCGVCGSDISR